MSSRTQIERLSLAPKITSCINLISREIDHAKVRVITQRIARQQYLSISLQANTLVITRDRVATIDRHKLRRRFITVTHHQTRAAIRHIVRRSNGSW